MGLYNIVFGHNERAPVILAVLGLTTREVGRFRDAWVEKDRIVIYTRNGGGNREHDWDDGKDAGPECDCTGCVMAHRLPKHPLYIGDQDDDFDYTYARVFFRFPDEYAKELAAIALDEPIDPSERWLKFIDGIKGGAS